MRDDHNMNSTDDHNSTYHDYGVPVVATLSFFLVTSMLLAFVGNIMVILTILRHPGMRTRTNMLLGNLAIADILVAVLDMPVALYTIIKHDWVLPAEFCNFNGFAVGLGLMLSIHTLMYISIHKFLSITRPFARNVTQFQIVLMMVAAWAWTILYNLTATPLIGLTETVYKKGSSQCGPVIPKETSQFIHSALNTFFNLVIPMTVMFYCYYRIFKEVQTHLERMRDFADVGMRNSLIQQKQITTTLFIVLIVFFLCWLPYIGYSMTLVFCGESCVPLILNPISYLFGYMNSACNPVIYALRSDSFRRGFKEIICGTSSRNPVSYSGVSSSRTAGILVSFRRSIFRTRDSRNGGRRQRGSQYAAAAAAARATAANAAAAGPPRRAVRTSRVSMVTCQPPVLPRANGEACRVVAIETDSGGTSETDRPSVSFEGGSHTQPDPSCSVNTQPYYAPWQPLQPQFPINHLSRSCQEIITSTSIIMTRSASAGDIPDLLHDAKKQEEQEDGTPKRRHKSEVHRPLMWQASVDHLTVTPVGRRRRVAGEMRSGQQQQQQQTHLRVRTIIKNMRRSLSDLFSIEEH